MAVRLFVGNLPYDATEADLREHFSAVGQLSYIYLPTDRETGKPRGFAFVEFSDRAQAEEAIRRFNNQLFKGRPMAVNEARAKEDRPQSGGPPRSFAPRPSGFVERERSEGPPREGATGRNFGPDAPPRGRRSKPSRGVQKNERGPKGPMRERSGGQFFGADVDDDDNYEDDLSEDNFATRSDDLEGEDDI